MVRGLRFRIVAAVDGGVGMLVWCADDGLEVAFGTERDVVAAVDASGELAGLFAAASIGGGKTRRMAHSPEWALSWRTAGSQVSALPEWIPSAGMSFSSMNVSMVVVSSSACVVTGFGFCLSMLIAM